MPIVRPTFLAWATKEDTTIAPENKTEPTPQFGNVTVEVRIHPARFGNVADVFSEVDVSTLIIVRSDRCSPRHLGRKTRCAPCNSGDAQNELAAIEFGPIKETSAELGNGRCQNASPTSRLARAVATRGSSRNGVFESAAKFTSNLVEEAPVGSIGDNFRRA